MKRLLCLFMGLLLAFATHAQKTEFRLNAYSGFSSFHGSGATRSSAMSMFVTDIVDLNSSKTAQVYGRQSEFPLSFEAQLMRVRKNGFIYGGAVSFDLLRSKVHIDTMFVSTMISSMISIYEAEGQTRLTNAYINLHPFVGKRLQMKKLTLDLLAGLDLGFCLSSREKGSANSIIHTPSPPVITITTDNKLAHPLLDIRPRIQLQLAMNRFAFLAGYSYGLTPYQSDVFAPAYSGFLRLGLSYRVF